MRIAVFAFLALATMDLSATTLTEHSKTLQTIPLKRESWYINYDGYGSVDFYSRFLEFKPKVAASKDQTHAVLLTPRKVFVGDHFEALVEYENLEPTRAIPNPWEVFWLFFNHLNKENNQKDTNYILVKTNGLEVGIAENELDQKYLWTDDSPQSTRGQKHQLRLLRDGNKLKIDFDGKVFSRTIPELKSQEGTLGLYTEDSRIRVHQVKWRKLKD